MKDVFKKDTKESTIDQLRNVEAIKSKAQELLDIIRQHTSFCRESNLSQVKLEECIMWATKSIYVEEE